MQKQDRSFATIIITAHGSDAPDERASIDQFKTLRKFTIAGKQGHLTPAISDLSGAIFLVANQFSKYPHIPFTHKIEILKDYLINHQLDLRRDRRLTADKRFNPIFFFSTSNVSYNHYYYFKDDIISIDDNSDEHTTHGIWLVDGSPNVLESEDFIKKNNLFDKFVEPVEPIIYKSRIFNYFFGDNRMEYTTSIFDLEKKIKQLYNVKYVNFIDLSCRSLSPIISLQNYLFSTGKDDEPVSPKIQEITPRAEPEIILIDDIEMEVIETQHVLPLNWIYVKIIKYDKYVYINEKTHEFTTEFPDFESKDNGKIINIKNIDFNITSEVRNDLYDILDRYKSIGKTEIKGIQMEIFEPLKIKGLGSIDLSENWKFVKIIGDNNYIIENIINGNRIIHGTALDIWDIEFKKQEADGSIKGRYTAEYMREKKTPAIHTIIIPHNWELISVGHDGEYFYINTQTLEINEFLPQRTAKLLKSKKKGGRYKRSTKATK